MADVVSTKRYLYLISEFNNGSETTTILENPKDNISPSEIKQLSSFAKNNEIFVGFNRYKSAYILSDTKTLYDINQG